MASFKMQPSRKIGDILVTPIGFGAMGISVGYGPVGSDEERLKVRNCRRYTQIFRPLMLLNVLGTRRYLRTRLYILGHR